MKEATEELKKKIESILFATGKKLDVAEIAKLCRLSHNIPLVEKILKELKEKYGKEDSSLMLVREDTAWKLTVREKYVSLIKNLVTKTELSKTIMETLAVIAYKVPVLQSELIKVRTNKAYDHLRELERTGYITRKKKGRTKLIELTPKFFEYFDVPPEKLRERFKTVEELEKAVGVKEAELREAKTEEKEKKGETEKAKGEVKKETEKEISRLDKVLKEKEEKVPEVDLIDKEGHAKKLNTYDSEIAEGTEFEEPKSNIEVVAPSVEGFEVVNLGMTSEQKEHLVEEAKHLLKEDEEFLKHKKETAAAAEKEKAFAKKFAAVGEGEEAASEEEGALEAEEAPAVEEAEPAEVEAETPAVEEKPEEAPPEEPKPAIPELKTKAEEQKEERVNAKGIAAEAAEHRKSHDIKAKEGKKLFEKGIPKGIQDKIDDRVEEIVFGKKKEEKEEPKKKEEKGGTPEHY